MDDDTSGHPMIPGRVRRGSGVRRGDTWGVGFNPHRQQHRSPFDYFMVAAAFAVLLALVVWAIVG